MKRRILGGLLVLTLSTLAAADEIYVPSNTPGTGAPNLFPFTASYGEWRYQLMFAPNLLGGSPFTISDIAFAPAGTGGFTASPIEIRMSHTTASSSATFAVNLPQPITVLSTTPFSWTTKDKTWSPIGLSSRFNYNGTDRLTIEIRYKGGKNTGGFGGGCYSDRAGKHDRVWQSGAGAYSATTGRLGIGSGLKIRITVSRALIVPSGTAKPGTRLDFGLLAAADAGRAYQVGSSFGQGPIPIGTRSLKLSPDSLLMASTSGLLSFVFQNYAGTLDKSGRAKAGFAIPNLPALKGVRFHTAFVTIDANAPFGIGQISPSVLVTIQ